jgi:cytidylate kinase
MYRAAALVALERGIDPKQGAALAAAIEEAELHFDWKARPPRLHVGRRDVSARIRELDVAGVVSTVAAQPELRRVLVAQQRRIAHQHPRLVSEGRDQGSIVFPDAAVRFYLLADETIRAQRRAEQLRQSGQPVDAQRALDEIQHRDRIDSGRAEAPLVKPKGAIEINTTDKSIDEVLRLMETIVRETLAATGTNR